MQTAPPVEPTDVTTEAATDTTSVNAVPDAPAPTDGGANPDHNSCDPGGFYNPTALGGRYMRGVGAVQSNYNHNAGTTSMTFYAQASGTVGVSLNASVDVSINGLITKADATFGVGMTASITASMSNSVTFNVGSGHTGNAEYGVWRRKFTGVTGYIWSNCAKTQHYVTAYGPYRVGWYIWIE